MSAKQDSLTIARFIVFELFEVLLALVTILISVGIDVACMYLVKGSQDTLLDQNIYPTLSQFIMLSCAGLFRLGWMIALYYWRRRSSWVRIIGQCLVMLPLLGAIGVWGALAIEEIRIYDYAFFIAVPSIFAISSAIALIFLAIPMIELIRYRRAQRKTAKSSIL